MTNDPQKQKALRSAKKFFARCNQSLGGELISAYLEGMNDIKKLVADVEHFTEIKSFRRILEEFTDKPAGILKSFNGFMVGEVRDQRVEGTESKELLSDSVLQFHNDDLNLVTNEELEYQLKLEGVYTDSRRHYDKLMFDAGMDASGKSFVGANPLLPYMEHIRPGRVTLYLQSCFDKHFEKPSTARIAFRFIVYNYFKSAARFYLEWLPEIKGFADQLELRQTLSLMPADDDDDKGLSNINAEAINKLAETISKSEGLLSKVALDGINIVELNEKVNYLLNRLDEIDISAPSSGRGVSDAAPLSLAPDDVQNISPDVEVATLGTNQLVALLGKMQHTVLRVSALEEAVAITSSSKEIAPVSPMNTVHSALRNELSEMSHDNQMTVIDRANENIINLVSRLFENITGNDALHPEVSEQIFRAQLPLMRLALADNELFNYEEHPARQYINQLGNLCLKISSTEEEGFAKLQDSIDRLVDDYDGDEDIFDELNEDLSVFLESSEAYQEDEIPEEDEVALQGALPDEVSDYMTRLESGIKREFMFHRFSKMAWEVLLSRIHSTHGVGSYQWKLATNTYSEMIWSTQVDSATDREKQQVLRRMPKIVNTVRNLFSEFELSDGVREAILTYMFRIHMEVVNGTPLMEIDDNFAEPGGAAPTQDVEAEVVEEEEEVVSLKNVFTADSQEEVVEVEAEQTDIEKMDPSLAYQYSLESTEEIDFGEAHEITDRNDKAAAEEKETHDQVVQSDQEASDVSDASPVGITLDELTIDDITLDDITLDDIEPEKMLAQKSRQQTAESSATVDASEEPVTKKGVPDEDIPVLNEKKSAPTPLVQDNGGAQASSSEDKTSLSGADDAEGAAQSQTDSAATSSRDGLSLSAALEKELEEETDDEHDGLLDHRTSSQEDLTEAFEVSKDYKVGDLFELNRDGIKHRYQLTHVSTIFGKYTFREFGTRNLIEMSKPDLVIHLMSGEIKKLSNARLFENSLESVISQIRMSKDESSDSRMMGG